MAYTDCVTCGCTIHLGESQMAHLKKTGDTYYCAVGHRQHFIVGETAEQRRIKELERALDRAKTDLDDAMLWSCAWCMRKVKRWHIYDHLRRIHGFPGSRELKRKKLHLLEKNP